VFVLLPRAELREAVEELRDAALVRAPKIVPPVALVRILRDADICPREEFNSRGTAFR
jgi:hypothetical protein